MTNGELERRRAAEGSALADALDAKLGDTRCEPVPLTPALVQHVTAWARATERGLREVAGHMDW